MDSSAAGRITCIRVSGVSGEAAACCHDKHAENRASGLGLAFAKRRGMNSGALLLAAVALSSFVVACGSESGADPTAAAPPLTVASRAALPACDASMEGRIAYATDEGAVLVCVGGAWQELKGAGGAQGAAGPQGDDGAQGDAGATSLVDLVEEPPGIHCGIGGVRIESGIDADGNGTLDPGEVSDTAYVCNSRPTARRVFVTSAAYDGNLGGVAGADQKCQAAADATPALQGATFRAWISTAAESPAQRFSRDAPLGFMRVDGVKIANGWEDLLDGDLLETINVTEQGVWIPYPHVWTNTLANGTHADRDDCSGWTSVAGKGTLGQGWVKNQHWSGPSTLSLLRGDCADAMRLYCFEQ